MKYSAIPFLRYSFFLVLGILFQIEFPFQLPFVEYFFLLAVFLLIISILRLPQPLKFRLRHWISAFSFASVFLFGATVVTLSDVKNKSDHISSVKPEIEAYEAIIISEPEEKTKSVKMEMQISGIKVADRWQKASGKLMAYFVNDTLSRKLKYGDLLIVNATPPLIDAPKNPYEFNLKRFYGFKGITHRQFINSNQFLLIGNHPQSRLTELAITIRKAVDAIFTKYIAAERERNIASALILGIKNELDEEIQYAYSATGTMHVLAVSGLHVGIIYGLMVFLTGFLLKLKHGKVIQSVVLFVLLWFYALVTGLCPSVLRAVTMLSIVIISSLINRKSNVFNTLFLTVFILLIINPFMLMEVGFQLSFLAVLGIVYLHPKIYNLLEFHNRAVDWVWTITVMSLAAQLATFPLGMLYFHQFPNLFLLSNLIVIPFAMLIMYIGLGFMVFFSIPFVGQWLGLVVEKMVWVLNQIILTIETIPHSLWLGIHISVVETWLIYAIIIAFILLFVQKEFRYMALGFALVLLFCGLQFIKIYQWQNQKRVIVYHVNKGFGMDVIDGRNSKFISDSLLPTDRSKMQFHILNHRWAKGIRNVNAKDAFTNTGQGNVFVVNGLKFCQITKHDWQKPANPIQVDYLIVSNNAVKNLYQLRDSFVFKTLILDGSNKTYLIEKWLRQSKTTHIPIYSTAINGAYIIDL